MTPAAANWRFDRLSASTREAAEIASLGAGLSLSAWLSGVIDEACATEALAPSSETATDLQPGTEIGDLDRLAASHRAEQVAEAAEAEAAEAVPLAEAGAGAVMLPVASMAPAGLGTRRDDDASDALLTDIANRGVREPLLIRNADGSANRYEIICGHRRWRAAQRVGLARIPATICTYDDAHAILASLRDNLQQGDLSPIDEAQTYLRLLTRCAVDTAAIVEASGRDRQHIIRSVRLLGLPPAVRQAISDGLLSPAHADLLLDAPNPEALADEIMTARLSIEATRERVAAPTTQEAAP